jgi:hypothetical protein
MRLQYGSPLRHLSTAQADKRPFILSDVVTNATAATIRQARRQAAAASQQESKKRCVALGCGVRRAAPIVPKSEMGRFAASGPGFCCGNPGADLRLALAVLA